jgi:hypothetical protein
MPEKQNHKKLWPSETWWRKTPLTSLKAKILAFVSDRILGLCCVAATAQEHRTTVGMQSPSSAEYRWSRAHTRTGTCRYITKCIPTTFPATWSSRSACNPTNKTSHSSLCCSYVTHCSPYICLITLLQLYVLHSVMEYDNCKWLTGKDPEGSGRDLF